MLWSVDMTVVWRNIVVFRPESRDRCAELFYVIVLRLMVKENIVRRYERHQVSSAEPECLSSYRSSVRSDSSEQYDVVSVYNFMVCIGMWMEGLQDQGFEGPFRALSRRQERV